MEVVCELNNSALEEEIQEDFEDEIKEKVISSFLEAYFRKLIFERLIRII